MQEKFVLKSKTIWGIIIILLPFLWSIFPDLPRFDLPESPSQEFNAFIDHLNEMIGFLLIIKGRIDAGKSEPTKLTLT